MRFQLGGQRLIDKVNSTRDEARLILLDLGITKDLDDPHRLLKKLVDDGSLVAIGDGLYHFSDEAQS